MKLLNAQPMQRGMTPTCVAVIAALGLGALAGCGGEGAYTLPSSVTIVVKPEVNPTDTSGNTADGAPGAAASGAVAQSGWTDALYLDTTSQGDTDRPHSIVGPVIVHGSSGMQLLHWEDSAAMGAPVVGGPTTFAAKTFTRSAAGQPLLPSQPTMLTNPYATTNSSLFAVPGQDLFYAHWSSADGDSLSHYTPTGGWSAPTALTGYVVASVVAPDGALMLVRLADNAQPEVLRYTPTEGLATKAAASWTLPASAGQISAVATGADGLMLVWLRARDGADPFDPSGLETAYAIYSAQSGWSESKAVSPALPPVSSSDPQPPPMAMRWLFTGYDQQTNTVQLISVRPSFFDEGGAAIFAQTFANGAWSDPQAIDTPRGARDALRTFPPSVASNARGELAVSWIESRSQTFNEAQMIRISRYSRDGGWSGPETVAEALYSDPGIPDPASTPIGAYLDQRLVMSATGRIGLLWTEHRKEGNRSALMLREYDAVSGWTAPQALAAKTDGSEFGAASLDLADNGAATVAWVLAKDMQQTAWLRDRPGTR